MAATFPRVPRSGGLVDAAQLEQALNAYRREQGLRALAPHHALAGAARQHAHRMRNLDFFAHEDPYDGTSARHRVAAIARGPWALIAENLAAGADDADQVLAGWIASPGHRANLLRPTLTHVGTAVAVGGRLRVYVAQVYAGTVH